MVRAWVEPPGGMGRQEGHGDDLPVETHVSFAVAGLLLAWLARHAAGKRALERHLGSTEAIMSELYKVRARLSSASFGPSRCSRTAQKVENASISGFFWHLQVRFRSISKVFA